MLEEKLKEITKEECKKLLLDSIRKDNIHLQSMINSIKDKPEDIPLFYDNIADTIGRMYKNSKLYHVVSSANGEFKYFKNEEGVPYIIDNGVKIVKSKEPTAGYS